MLRSGDTAFRVRDAMGLVAKALGIEHLAVHITIGGMTATAQAGGETVTLNREVAPLGVDASRIAALERLARSSKPGLTAEALAAEIDAIEATPALHSLPVIALSMAVASASFSYFNGGDLLATGAAAVGGGLGQAARTLLSRKGLNRCAMAALCAVLASGVYCLIVLGFGIRTFALAHAVGFISSALFLVPGFPLRRGPARPRAAPDDGRHHPAVLRRAADACRRLRPVHRRRSRGPHAGAARSGRPRHRTDNPAVARRRLLRRRLRLRHPVRAPCWSSPS